MTSGAGARSPLIWQRTSTKTPPIVDLTTLDASNNIVFSDYPTRIALLGVHNLIVVRTRDSLLVCNRRDAERIKELVSKLPPELQ